MKFTQRGSIEVILEAEPDRPDGVRLTVQDTGIGMDKETVENLFTRFYQADNSLRRRVGGSGLGLEISRTLARMMDGDITVTSEPGKGSIFVVSLRLPRAPAPKIDKAMLMDDAAWERRRTPVRRLRLLVAEDHPVNLKYLNLLIDRMGHEAVFCENGFEALQILNRESFDVVLLDYHMPVLDGIATTREIRALPSPASEVPVIMVTADVVNDTRQLAMDAGVTQFAPKPLQEADLRRALRRCGVLEGGMETVPAALETALRTVRSPKQLIDTQVHAELLSMMPAEMFSQLLDMLFKAPEGTALVLQQALQDEDLEAIVYQGHRLKGSCMLLGLRALTAVSGDIEKSGQAGDIKALRELKEVLAVDIADTVAALPLMARLAAEVTV
jgi:two-component system, sensor histidine kinase